MLIKLHKHDMRLEQKYGQIPYEMELGIILGDIRIFFVEMWIYTEELGILFLPLFHPFGPHFIFT